MDEDGQEGYQPEQWDNPECALDPELTQEGAVELPVAIDNKQGAAAQRVESADCVKPDQFKRFANEQDQVCSAPFGIMIYHDRERENTAQLV